MADLRKSIGLDIDLILQNKQKSYTKAAHSLNYSVHDFSRILEGKTNRKAEGSNDDSPAEK